MDHKRPRRTPRLSTGSLQGISKRELARLKAALDARWEKDNPLRSRSRGRPPVKEEIYAACKRIRPRMVRRKDTTLHDWYEALAADLQARSIARSKPTIMKFTREWMSRYLPLNRLPDGIVPYLINTQKGWEELRWLSLWASLCQQFPEVRAWLTGYQRQHGACPGELPHEILPPQLLSKIKIRYGTPPGPRLYDYLVREALRTSTDKSIPPIS